MRLPAFDLSWNLRERTCPLKGLRRPTSIPTASLRAHPLWTGLVNACITIYMTGQIDVQLKNLEISKDPNSEIHPVSILV